MKPVNLNQMRKARTRAEQKAKADENAIRFGRTKAEKLRETMLVEQASARLDQHKFDDD